MTTLAIDPGASGGLAWTKDGVTACRKMPETPKDLLDLIREIAPTRAVVEKVGGFAGMGQPGSAMFSFGQGFGHIEMALLALEIPCDQITPQAWMKGMGCGSAKSHASKTAWKNHLKEMAQRNYPALKVTLATADALLLLTFTNRLNRI